MKIVYFLQMLHVVFYTYCRARVSARDTSHPPREKVSRNTRRTNFSTALFPPPSACSDLLNVIATLLILSTFPLRKFQI